MLSARLVRLIEDNAEQLTRAVIDELLRNPRTPAYHKLTREEIRHRVYDVYHNLGNWLGHESEDVIEAFYTRLGRERAADNIPLSEVICALTSTKNHLFEYARSAGMVDSVVDLYEQQELRLLVSGFFDRAIFYTARGYEGEGVPVREASQVAAKI
jgi:hypothetical protein